jgi:transposase
MSYETTRKSRSIGAAASEGGRLEGRRPRPVPDRPPAEHDAPKRLPLAGRVSSRGRAHLVFIDETGFLLAPLVRRTWGLRGRTPLMRQRTRHHRRVSAIGGLSISPQRRRLGWYLQFHVDGSIRQEQVLDFLRHLLRHLAGRIIVVWDRLASHRSRLLRQWLRRCRRLHLEYLPGSAPELNPNEYGWAYLKGNPLANYCPQAVDELHTRVAGEGHTVAWQPFLLRSFVQATGLPIRLPP